MLVLPLLVSIAACGDETSTRGAPTTTATALSPASEAMEGTCVGLDHARAGDASAAKAAFHDEAHDPLHRLADAVPDREAKGALLEAKGRIENGDTSSDAFAALEEAVAHAAETAGMQVPERCRPKENG